MQSVELLLDPALDARVREQWRMLAEAGLPSQARHAGATNAPHVTLAVREQVDPANEPRLAEVARVLPLPVRLGATAVFGRHRYVLVLLLVVDVPLLALHAAVADALGRSGDGDPLTEPGRWTPHVTLARGLDAAQVGRCLEVLGGARPLEGNAVDCRRWDNVERRAWSVLG
jgi:2'-5' RNA ligase